MIKEIILLLIAAVPFTVLFSAYKRKYAEKRGLSPDSPDAIIGYAKQLAVKGLLLLISSTTVLCLFFYVESNRALFSTWLENIAPYSEAVARFLPGVFVIYVLLLLSLAIFYTIVYLLDGRTSLVNTARKATLKGLFIGLFIGGATTIAIELFCITAGSASFAKSLLLSSPSLMASVILLALYIASIMFFLYAIYECGSWASGCLTGLARVYDGKHYKK